MPLVYASTDTSRCRLQDSRPGWIRYFLSCRALASPTTCRFIPALSDLSRHPRTVMNSAGGTISNVALFRRWSPVQEDSERGALPRDIARQIDVAVATNVVEVPGGMKRKIKQFAHTTRLKFSCFKLDVRHIQSRAWRVGKEQFLTCGTPSRLDSAFSADLPATGSQGIGRRCKGIEGNYIDLQPARFVSRVGQP